MFKALKGATEKPLFLKCFSKSETSKVFPAPEEVPKTARLLEVFRHD
jgi:hypothetical protein